MELAELAGRKTLKMVPNLNVRHPFDPDASGVVFTLDDTTYLIFEDPDDGYRSNAGPILQFDGPAFALGGNVSPTYIQEAVLCRHITKGEHGDKDDILELVSEETGAVIFRIGTSDVDDYYPSFVCEWSPGGLSQNSKRRAHD